MIVDFEFSLQFVRNSNCYYLYVIFMFIGFLKL